MNEKPAEIPIEVFAVFCGPIDQGTVRTLLNGLAIATQGQPQVKHVHILFQSAGGTVGDGVCLYNFFAGFPIDLTVYNAGTVMSIATLSYLGAKFRKVSAHATFMLHRTTCAPQAVTSDKLETLAHSVAIDDKRAEDILRRHIKISDQNWSDLRNHEFWFTAEDSVKSGLATDIGEFRPPRGQRIFS